MLLYVSDHVYAAGEKNGFFHCIQPGAWGGAQPMEGVFPVNKKQKVDRDDESADESSDEMWSASSDYEEESDEEEVEKRIIQTRYSRAV